MPLAEARSLFLRKFSPENLLATEELPVARAAGRVTSSPVEALLSSPAFHSAAMDGYAVRAAVTFAASDQDPVILRAGADAIPVNTGHPMPENRDAVIMIEDILETEPGILEIRKPAYPWQNVRKVGEDVVATELLFPSNHLLMPHDLAALVTAGVRSVSVWEKVRMTIIPTGSELISSVEAGYAAPPPGQTIESNASMLAAMAAEAGARVEITDIVPDDPELIKRAVLQAVCGPSHIVVIIAGSSAGTRDYTAGTIEELGQLFVHGVAIMPGKPTALGAIQGKPVIGNPGYPVSSAISFEQFALPLIYSLSFKVPPKRQEVVARAGRNMPSRAGIREFRRMIVGRVGEATVAVPLRSGAGSITTLTRANGILEIPENAEGIEERAEIQISLLRPDENLDATLLCVGSHDLSLDVIKDFLQRSSPACYLYSTHSGSLGGLLAARNGLCHIAGTHLLDPETGEYNTSHIKKYLAGIPCMLITLVHRQQGFIIPKGNPKGIKGIHDLARPDITFVNRQKGAGTRVLLDFCLEKEGMDAARIKGYGNEEFTHMAVAVDVLSGRADTGLGILAAARALGLDFIPLAEERYDLLINRAVAEHPGIVNLLKIINDGEFKRKIEKMGGYSTRETGALAFES